MLLHVVTQRRPPRLGVVAVVDMVVDQPTFISRRRGCRIRTTMPLKLRVRAVEHLKASVAVRGFAVCTPLGRSIRARERVNTLAIPPIAHDDVLYATLLIQNGAARHGVYPLIRVNVSGHDQVYSILEKHALHRRLHRIALSLVHDVGLVPRRVRHSHNKRRACVVDAAQPSV